jgi:hypothetical protein
VASTNGRVREKGFELKENFKVEFEVPRKDEVRKLEPTDPSPF